MPLILLLLGVGAAILAFASRKPIPEKSIPDRETGGTGGEGAPPAPPEGTPPGDAPPRSDKLPRKAGARGVVVRARRRTDKPLVAATAEPPDGDGIPEGLTDFDGDGGEGV